jgi:hypothetical protein
METSLSFTWLPAAFSFTTPTDQPNTFVTLYCINICLDSVNLIVIKAFGIQWNENSKVYLVWLVITIIALPTVYIRKI